MKYNFKHYNIFIGGYGSGKTEISLTLANYSKLILKKNTTLVDLDIVNPYFRSSNQIKFLEKNGIECIKPNFALTSVDIPSLPARIKSVFLTPKDHSVIIDVGGDETGATALGQFSRYINNEKDDANVYIVLNSFRPLTSSINDANELISRIKIRSRVEITGIINNANLAENTTIDDIKYGYDFTNKVASKLNIKNIISSGKEEFKEHLPEEIKNNYIIIDPCMRPDWLVNSL